MKYLKINFIILLALAFLGIVFAAMTLVDHVHSSTSSTSESKSADGEISASFELLKMQMNDVSPSAPLLVAAHRGQWREAPENSLAAIDGAIKDGAEIVEIDVRLTKDGVPVLMHDASVDRTTDGTGRVGAMTLAEIKTMHLRNARGGANAAISRYTVPTLEEAMNLAKNRAMLNLDRGWGIRYRILSVLNATETVDHGIFMGSPTVAEAEEFMALDNRIQYMQVVNDSTAWKAFAFKNRQPVAVQVLFNSRDDPQVQPEYLHRLAHQSRVWINSFSDLLSAGNTDAASLRLDPEQGWNNLVSTYRASIIQTDNVEAIDYWREGGSLSFWDHRTFPSNP